MRKLDNNPAPNRITGLPVHQLEQHTPGLTNLVQQSQRREPFTAVVCLGGAVSELGNIQCSLVHTVDT